MALAPEDAACLDTLSDAPDAVLLARAQGGDDDAFTEVVQRYDTRLRSYLTRLLNDVDLAADVLQETLIDLHREIVRDWGTRTAPPTNLPGWLYRAATNNAIDALRRRSFRARLLGLLTISAPAPRDPAADATERLAAARALARLSPEDRACILLNAALGLRYQEIARVLEIGEAAARQRITRAKARFRRLYEEEG